MSYLKKIISPIFIFIISILIIISTFTYTGYQDHKTSIKDDWPIKNIADDINDDLEIDSSNISSIANNNLSRAGNATYLAFDENEMPFLAPNYTWTLQAVNDDNVANMTLEYTVYQELKGVCEKLVSILEQDDRSDINITIGYSGIDDNQIFVNPTYLEIDGENYINGNSGQTITCKLTSLYCPFLVVERLEGNEGYYFDSAIKKYDYLETFFKKNYQNNEIENTGYYKLITPKDDPFGKQTLLNGTDERYYSFCIQKLSSEYSRYPDVKSTTRNTENQDNRIGYLVWNQFDDIFENYTLFNYLIDYYYVYLIVLVILVMGIWGLKGNTFMAPIIKTPKIDPPLTPLPDNLEVIDLNQIISELIKSSSNVLRFKQLTIIYQPKVMVINGNREQIIRLVNRLYNFALKYSNTNGELIIKLEDNELSFYNQDFKYTSDDLLELNDCLEIIEHHRYTHHFDQHILSFKEVY